MLKPQTRRIFASFFLCSLDLSFFFLPFLSLLSLSFLSLSLVFLSFLSLPSRAFLSLPLSFFNTLRSSIPVRKSDEMSLRRMIEFSLAPLFQGGIAGSRFRDQVDFAGIQ